MNRTQFVRCNQSFRNQFKFVTLTPSKSPFFASPHSGSEMMARTAPSISSFSLLLSFLSFLDKVGDTTTRNLPEDILFALRAFDFRTGDQRFLNKSKWQVRIILGGFAYFSPVLQLCSHGTLLHF